MSLLSTLFSALGVLTAVGLVGVFVAVFIVGDFKGPDAHA